MTKKDYDGIVVGSGPNGLSAAIVLQQAGLSVLLLESKSTIGGGMRSEELTLPGYLHDICSAIHPFAVQSPFWDSLPLQAHGLEYIYPPAAAAHPLETGTAAILYHSIAQTASSLGVDGPAYQRLMDPLLIDWPAIADFVLKPLSFPAHPLAISRFGLQGMFSAMHLARKRFRSPEALGLFAGMAAHSMLPLSRPSTAAFALIFLLLGHGKGWPLPKGGSGQISGALASYFLSRGGKIETNHVVHSLDQLPSAHAVLLDVGPRQLLRIAGHRLSPLYRWQLKRFRYGPGVFKMDWALDSPIPFKALECSLAGTVHLGNRIEEIAEGERLIGRGLHPEKPFVLLAQQSLFDPTRAPQGKHTAWAYCHVPNGSLTNMSEAIEKQVERFAPGFRDRILARHIMNTADLEEYNSNYIGGDITGGIQDLSQLFTRPALRFSPYRASVKGLYLCSASTPPGGGVHGLCGYYAGKRALKDVFKL